MNIFHPLLAVITFALAIGCDGASELNQRQTTEQAVVDSTDGENQAKVDEIVTSDSEAKSTDTEDSAAEETEETAAAAAEETAAAAEETSATDEIPPPGEFTLTSQAFTEGNILPLKHACTGKGGNNISPQLSWANPPANTNSLVLIVDDEDSPCGSGTSACRHWQVYNIPTTVTALPENSNDASAIDGLIKQGNNYNNSSEYAGPCPPNTHNYKFTIYALDSNFVALSDGTRHTRASFEAAFTANIIDSDTLIGKFIP